MDRNVFGRMIAASLAFLAEIHRTEATLEVSYKTRCLKLLGDKSDLCSIFGESKVPFRIWRHEECDKLQGNWSHQVCTRVTDPFEERVMRDINPLSKGFESRQAEEIALTRKIFSGQMKKRNKRTFPSELFMRNKHGKVVVVDEAYHSAPWPNQDALFHHRVGHTGLTVDLARSAFPIERLIELVERMSQLGFDALQLRLVDDFSPSSKCLRPFLRLHQCDVQQMG